MAKIYRSSSSFYRRLAPKRGVLQRLKIPHKGQVYTVVSNFSRPLWDFTNDFRSGGG